MSTQRELSKWRHDAYSESSQVVLLRTNQENSAPLATVTPHAPQDDRSNESSVLLQPEVPSSTSTAMHISHHHQHHHVISQDPLIPSLLSTIFRDFDRYVLGQGAVSAAAILSSVPLSGPNVSHLFFGQLSHWATTPHELAAILVCFAGITGPVHVIPGKHCAHVTLSKDDATKVKRLDDQVVCDDMSAYHAITDNQIGFMTKFMKEVRPSLRATCDLPMRPMSVMPARNKKRLNDSSTDPAARRPHWT